MNHIYKVVFNKATRTFVAVAEYARAAGKSSTVGATPSVAVHRFTMRLLTIALSLVWAGQAYGQTINDAQVGNSGNLNNRGKGLEAVSLGTPGNPLMNTGKNRPNQSDLTATNLTATSLSVGYKKGSSDPNGVNVDGEDFTSRDGSGATGIGNQTIASLGATAVGAGARGYGWSSVAVGLTSYAGGEYSVAVGRHATTEAQRSLALGVVYSVILS